MKKKVIVTGGLGFIGSNLIELLLNESYQVINIDKNTYSSNFYNVKEFKNNKNYSFIKCDIASPRLSKIIFKSNPIGIFNLAAETHVDRSIDSPESFIKSNIYGVFNILEIFKKFSRKKKSSLEKYEDIELLRFLDLGVKIKMKKISASSFAVDNKADLKRVNKFLSEK